MRKAIYPYAWGAQKSLDGASHVIAFIALKEPEIHWNSSHVQHVVRDIRKLPEDVYQFYKKAYTNFGENDFKTFESQRSGFDWSCKQTYIALGNMLTAAAALRIDSCPIEGFIPQNSMKSSVIPMAFMIRNGTAYPSWLVLATGQEIHTVQRRDDLWKNS